MDPTSLQLLHDIVTPAPTPRLPPAPGWYALGFCLLLLLTWFSIKQYQAWQRDRYRRESLVILTQIEKGLADPDQYQQLLPTSTTRQTHSLSGLRKRSGGLSKRNRLARIFR